MYGSTQTSDNTMYIMAAYTFFARVQKTSVRLDESKVFSITVGYVKHNIETNFLYEIQFPIIFISQTMKGRNPFPIWSEFKVNQTQI